MIVRLGTAPRIPSLDFEQFQEHWRTSHADVVSLLPGLRRYQQFHAVLHDARPVLPYPGFDACSALQFDDVDQMDAAFASDTFQQAVKSDEAEFVDKTLFRGVVGHWRPDGDADLGSGGPVVALTFLNAEPGVTAEHLADRLAGGRDESAQGAGSIVADPALHAGRFAPMASVVRVVSHPDVESAQRGVEATRAAAGQAEVIGTHVARIVDVPVGTSAGRPIEERNV